jgi:hypothetical protein
MEQNNEILSRALIILTPFALLSFLIVAIVGRNVAEAAVAFEIIVVVSLIFLIKRTKKSERGEFQRHNKLLLSIVEIALLGAIIVASTFSSSYMRPFVFFPLTVLLYSFYFIEAIRGVPSRFAFTIKLLFTMFIMVWSFSSLYPGFVGSDAYRDFYIAESLLKNSGGIPHQYVGLVWYDFSPIMALLYVSSSMIMGISIRLAELLLGYLLTATSVVAVGAISWRLSGNSKQCLLAMLMVSTMPYFTFWATSPIPEILGTAMSLLIILLFSVQGSSLPLQILLIVIELLTQPGPLLVLIVMLIALYLIVRQRAMLKVVVISIMTFFGYAAYVSVVGSTGFVQVLYFIALLGQSSVPNFTTIAGSFNALLLVSHTVAGTLWWVCIAALAWFGLIEMLRNKTTNIKTRAFSLLAIAFFGVGILFDLRGGATSAQEYVGLIGYPMIAIPASIYLSRLQFSIPRSFLTYTIVAMMVVSVVVNPLVSPDLWQHYGQGQYAANNRIKDSTTFSELQSQTFLNQFDHSYTVVGNYVLQFVNLTFSPIQGSQGGTMYVGVSLTANNIQTPFVAVISNRAAVLSFESSTVFGNSSAESMNQIYSNGISYEIYYR